MVNRAATQSGRLKQRHGVKPTVRLRYHLKSPMAAAAFIIHSAVKVKRRRCAVAFVEWISESLRGRATCKYDFQKGLMYFRKLEKVIHGTGYKVWYFWIRWVRWEVFNDSFLLASINGRRSLKKCQTVAFPQKFITEHLKVVKNWRQIWNSPLCANAFRCHS